MRRKQIIEISATNRVAGHGIISFLLPKISSCPISLRRPQSAPFSVLPAKCSAKSAIELTTPRNHTQSRTLGHSDSPASLSPLAPFHSTLTHSGLILSPLWFYIIPPLDPHRSSSWSHPRPQPTPDSDSWTSITPVSTLGSEKSDHKRVCTLRPKFYIQCRTGIIIAAPVGTRTDL